MKLKELSIQDLQGEQKHTFIIPLGATEQHGPFIPFGTDTYILEYLLEIINVEFPDIIIAPMLEYSRSQEHKGFYGTMYLQEQTIVSVLEDLCQSIVSNASRILFVSFHENSSVVNKFIAHTDLDNNITLDQITMFDDKDDELISKLIDGPLDDHAGNTEISNMLAIDDGLVSVPDDNYPKSIIDNPWDTDNLSDKSQDGIADSHPQWNVSAEIGQDILDIYSKRIVMNIEKLIS